MAKKSGSSAAAGGEPIAAGVFAFEGDWEIDLRKNWSIGSVLDAMQDFGDIRCVHRDIGAVEELQHYIDSWLQDPCGGYQVRMSSRPTGPRGCGRRCER